MAPPDRLKTFCDAVAEDLRSQQGRALVVAGPALPPEAHALCCWINAQVQAPVDYFEEDAAGPQGSLVDLTRDCEDGKVECLIVLGCNPAYDAPPGVGVGNALARAKLRVRGLPLANYVWWIGIGNAGTLISALLLTRQDWRASINCIAEAMTIFAVSIAGLFPIFCVVAFSFTGAYAPLFWLQLACNCAAPQILWWRRARASLPTLIAVSILVLIGMWLERILIVWNSLSHSYLATMDKIFTMTSVDWLILIPPLGFFALLFLILVRIVPTVSMHDCGNSRMKGAGHDACARR